MADVAVLRKLEAELEELARLRSGAGFRRFHPYPRQSEFLAMSATCRERLFMAGNQLGKTECGAYEMAVHLTGEYPADWKGRRWDRPVRAWCAGESTVATRDILQKKLCGEPGVEGALGTGMIPRESFVGEPSLARGATDAYDTIQVKHKSGGISVLRFKSYEQGRKKFQGESLDILWLDEEPPQDIYSEALTRTSATKGMIYITFTPLNGRSAVVNRFLDEVAPGRGVVIMTIYDAGHFTDEERAATVAAYPAHERDARARGIPMMGSGRIFPYAEETILEEMIVTLPSHWFYAWGMDFGTGGSDQAHPWGAVLMGWDKDADCLHLLRELRMQGARPLDHAAAMKPFGLAIPVIWPQDGTARETSGDTLAQVYKKHGVKMLPMHATWPDGGVSTEAGIVEMQERMTTSRWKVGANCPLWLDEYRLYHRKDGLIVKVKDDLLSASRVFTMAKRYARQLSFLRVTAGWDGNFRKPGTQAKDVDFDLFGTS